jgi:hypothetical protein
MRVFKTQSDGKIREVLTDCESESECECHCDETCNCDDDTDNECDCDCHEQVQHWQGRVGESYWKQRNTLGVSIGE